MGGAAGRVGRLPNDLIFTKDYKGPRLNVGITKAFHRGIKGLAINGEKLTSDWLHQSLGTCKLEALQDEQILKLMGHTRLVTSKENRHQDYHARLLSALAIRKKLNAKDEVAKILPFMAKNDVRSP